MSEEFDSGTFGRKEMAKIGNMFFGRPNSADGSPSAEVYSAVGFSLNKPAANFTYTSEDMKWIIDTQIW